MPVAGGRARAGTLTVQAGGPAAAIVMDSGSLELEPRAGSRAGHGVAWPGLS